MDHIDVLTELAFTIGSEAGANGCALDQGAARAVREVFGMTVEYALNENRSVWEDARNRRYVHKKVAQMTRAASRVARLQNNGVISAEIFDEAAFGVIANARLVWERAGELAELRPGWEIFGGRSIFCVGLAST